MKFGVGIDKSSKEWVKLDEDELDIPVVKLTLIMPDLHDFSHSSNTNDEDILHSIEDIDDDDNDLPDLESLTEIQEVRHYPLRHRIRHRRRLVLRLRQTRIPESPKTVKCSKTVYYSSNRTGRSFLNSKILTT